MRRPYRIHQYDNAVNVVGHHNIFIQYGIGKMRRNLRPALSRDFTKFIQSHNPIHHIAKQAGAILCAYGNEIRACLRVVVTFKPNAVAVMDVRVVFHSLCFLRKALGYRVGEWEQMKKAA